MNKKILQRSLFAAVTTTLFAASAFAATSPATNGTSVNYYFDVLPDNQAVNSADKYAGLLTLTQRKNGTEWTLTSEFANSAAKIKDIEFSFANRAGVVLDPTRFSTLS